MIDSWNPSTYNAALNQVLAECSQLIVDYYAEARRLMDEHRNSSTYQSLKPNRFHSDYLDFREQTLTPVLSGTRIRVWHYSRLLDDEVENVQHRLAPSSLDFLQDRLSKLVDKYLLSNLEAETIYKESTLQSQGQSRSGRMWTVTVPVPSGDSGVLPLLESWGGESAYFWLSSESLAAKLRGLGSPRISEMETSLSDELNAFKVSETVLQAWARRQGVAVVPTGCDLPIKNCLDTAKLIRVHTKGEVSFDEVAKTYPEGVSDLLGE